MFWRKYLIAAVPLVIGVVLAACGGGNSPTTTSTPVAEQTAAAAWRFDCAQTPTSTAADAGAFPVQVKDDAGRQVTVTAPPKAIVSLSAGHTEMLYAIGAGDQMKADDAFSDCPTAAAGLPHIDAFSPSVESIVGLEPDLVIVFYDPGGLVDALQSAGIAAVVLEAPSSIDGVFQQMQLLGTVTGHEQEAAEVVASMRAALAAIETKVAAVDKGPRVFHELDNTYYTAGPGSFVGDLYGVLKAHNVADSTGEPFPQMTAEAIIAADPEVIILADEDAGESPATVATRPGWSGISAVKSGRVHTIDPDIVSRPGPRLVEALETLGKILYPDLFK